MASEIRVDKINSLSGVGTVTLSPTGVDIAGITTAATLRATTGIVTSLTAGSLTSLGAVSGTTGTFSGAVSGTTGTFSGAVSGTTGTFSAAVSGTTGTFTDDVSIADAIVHTGDNSKIRFPANDQISFETGGTEIARFDNNQLFLVGATSAVNSSSAKVQVAHTNANARIDIARFSADDAPPYLEFHKSRNGTVGGNTIVQSGDEIGRIRWSGNNGSNTTAGAEIRSYVDGSPGGSNDMPARMIFYTTPDGSGTPTERFRIDKNGQISLSNGNLSTSYAASIVGGTNLELDTTGVIKFRNATNQKASITSDGLCFGTDTAAANALDDYEEGTWTPSYSYSGGGSPTLSEALGHYRKIGAYVYCTFTTTNSAQGGGSGNWVLNNLPFTSSGTNGTRHHGGITYFTGMASGLRSNMVVYNAGATTTANIYHQNSAETAIEDVTRNYISSNTTIRGFVIFMTN